jgi:hypothetical protein
MRAAHGAVKHDPPPRIETPARASSIWREFPAQQTLGRCLLFRIASGEVDFTGIDGRLRCVLVGPPALDYALSIGIPRSNFAGSKTTSEGFGQILDRLGRAVKAYTLGDRQFALRLRDKE